MNCPCELQNTHTCRAENCPEKSEKERDYTEQQITEVLRRHVNVAVLHNILKELKNG